MGLDVYVGSLIRYYAGDWETIIEQAGREGGFEVQVVRAGGHGDGAADAAEVAEAVAEWRAGLAQELERPLDWVEDASAPYFTDKPAWDGYGSLQVLAACVERGEDTLPNDAVEDWGEHEAWKQATGADRPRFAALYFPELWLPLELGGVVEIEEAGGNDVVAGSSVELLAILREVNEATYRGTEDELARWRFDGAEPGGPFEDAAKFGLAVFLYLTEKSAAERLPMRLDY